MADNYGLMGANNPIFQASQQMSQQAVQMRNVAAEGIVNKTLQSEAKKLGAQLDMWTKLATESTSPTTRNMAFQNLGNLLNVDFSDAMFDEDAIAELKDIRKVITDKSGTYLPDKAKEIFAGYVSRRGKDFISKEDEEAFQKNQESGYLAQGRLAQRQIKATPGLVESPEAMAYAQAEQDRLLVAGGPRGEAEALKDNDVKDPATASLLEFELVTGTSSNMRGTPQYRNAYMEWLKLKNPGAGSGNTVILMTDQGAVRINKQTGIAEPVKTGTGEGLAKPLPVGASEDLAALNSLQRSIKEVEDLFDPKFVGPADSVLGAVSGYTGIGANFNEQLFRAKVATLRKTLFDEGGKALTATEVKILAPFIPETSMSAIKFKAQMQTFKEKYQDIMDKKKKAYKETGYGVPTTNTSDGKVKTASDYLKSKGR